MSGAYSEGAVPQQGLDVLAHLAERALRNFLAATQCVGLLPVKTRIVVLRSKLTRYRKLFEGGLVDEAVYFRVLRDCGKELIEILEGVGSRGTRTKSAELAGLEAEIAAALRHVREIRLRKVFISYRRDDSAYIVDRIAQHLRSRLGQEAVFRDSHSIAPGDDFARRIDAALADSRVCLVVIGRRWQGALPDGSSRIDKVDDFVRYEVGSALARSITTVPVLTEGLQTHELEDLPPDLRGIRTRNALVLRPDPDFDHDMERLTSFVIRRLA